MLVQTAKPARWLLLAPQQVKLNNSVYRKLERVLEPQISNASKLRSSSRCSPCVHQPTHLWLQRPVPGSQFPPAKPQPQLQHQTLQSQLQGPRVVPQLDNELFTIRSLWKICVKQAKK